MSSNISVTDSDRVLIKKIEKEPAPFTSFLSPEAVRWMNRRRPNASSTAAQIHILPSRAIQLKALFKGLDFDGSGSIDIKELKEAVHYVAKNSGSDPIFKDPKKLTDFFVTMDTDGNGSVDFNEFLVGMTAEGGTNDTASSNAKVRQIFYDFANSHRRQMMIDRMGNDQVSDTEKLEEVRKLFSIAYFKDEPYNETLHEQISRVQKEVKQDMKELQEGPQKKLRRKEVVRAREASLFFESKRATRRSGNIILNSLEKSNIPDALFVTQQIEQGLRKTESMHMLRNEATYVPDLATSGGGGGTGTLKLRAMRDLRKAKGGRTLGTAQSLLELPPISLRQQIIDKAQEIRSPF
jgi:Ca2+-binding EF-hand superfamily protein